MKKNKDVIVLDTSALLAYIEDEPGAAYVDETLTRAERGEIIVCIAFVSLTEVFYVTMQEKDEATAETRTDLIKSLACTIEESSESLNLTAARFKAGNRISLADAYIAALCKEREGVLVHKDPEFEKLTTAVNQHALPYKA